jgi:hypothetical protein
VADASKRDYTCPSATCAPGATLLGTLGRDGRMHPVRTEMRVDAAFVAEASRIGPPEARMRFAGRCHEGGCAQWTGSRCGVIDRVMQHLGAAAGEAQPLQPCVIRASCRWYAQTGAAACTGCSYVVTDAREVVAAE